MRLYFFILLFHFIVPSTVFAQSDTLKLYTKEGCGNCKYTKSELSNRSINYIEYSLDRKENATAMLKCLSKIGYKGKIFLPVIVLKNKVFHPVFEMQDSLMSLSLELAIDSLEKTIATEHLQLASPTIKEVKTAQPHVEIESDCESHFEPIYLICQNFKVKNDASQLSAKLKREGFPNAGFIEHQNFFRVYYTFFLDSDAANRELQKMRINNKASYLLTIK